MQATRKVIKVFIASPGDLVKERAIAREIGEEFNSLWAESTGYQIEMVGWEETTGGMGRPQEIINKDLARCELFIGMLWRRWGTPPDTCGKFSSGFEEEFFISLDRYKKESIPQISMFFKEVDSDSLRDPGTDLQKVIKFKENLINKKETLFETFTDSKDFEKKIRKRLASYVSELTSKDREINPPENSNESNVLDNNIPVQSGNQQFFSSGTESFISDFISDLQCSGSEAVSPERIAFFRLSSNIISSPSNDDAILGAHDSNLIYRNSDSFEFGQKELNGLILSGVDNYDSHNTPLWKWINESKLNLEVYTLLTKDDRKRKAIDVMRFIAHDIKTDRDIFLNDWLEDEHNENVKVSALKYIGEVGTLNDIPLITKEYERNEVRTSSSAIDAIMLISFRNGVGKGFDAILEYHPSNVSNRILETLKEKESLIDSRKLLDGLNEKNKDIREFCISSLIGRKALDEFQLEGLLKHEDYNIRYSSINELSSINYKLYKEKAKEVLIKNEAGKMVDDLYKKYIKDNLFREDISYLEMLGKKPYVFNADSLLALARIDKKYIPEVKAIISDNAESFISSLLENMPNPDEFTDFLKDYKEHINGKVTFSCVEYICEMMKREDLNLIRGYIKSKGSYLSAGIMMFFKKYGDFDDVLNLCNTKIMLTGTLLFEFGDNLIQNKMLADTALSLSKGKESELLDIDIPIALKIKILSQMTASGFKNIPLHKIADLLNVENATLREKTCLKVVESMTKNQMKNLLSEYAMKDVYYYNTIHWLDFGINTSKDVSRKAIKRYLDS